MQWTKLAAALATFAVAVTAGGGGVRLLALAGRAEALATLAVVVASVGALAVLGARSRRWRANPYW